MHDGALHQYPRSRWARPSNFRYHPSSSTCRITRTRTRCRNIRTLCHSPCSSTRTRTRTEVSAELFCNSCQILAVCFLFAGFLSATHAYALPMRHPHQPHTPSRPSPPHLSTRTRSAPGQARAPASNNNSSRKAGGSSFKAGCPQENKCVDYLPFTCRPPQCVTVFLPSRACLLFLSRSMSMKSSFLHLSSKLDFQSAAETGGIKLVRSY